MKKPLSASPGPAFVRCEAWTGVLLHLKVGEVVHRSQTYNIGVMIDFQRLAWPDPSLESSEGFLARIIETNADGLVIIDGAGTVTFANVAAERLLGIPRERMIGRSFSDPMLRFSLPDTEPLPVEANRFDLVLQSGEAIHDLEALFDRADGSRLDLSVTTSPLVDADGAITGAVISLRDGTGRAQTEAALRQQSSVLRAQAELLELAHDAIFVRNASSGAIVFWNRAAEELYGYSRAEAIGAVSHELLRTQFPQPRAKIEETMVLEGRWDGELIHWTRDGTKITVESRWALQRDEMGEPVAFLEINRDITRRKQAEAELAHRVNELTAAKRVVEERNRQMAAVNSSMTAISRGLDLSQVLQNIVDAARELGQAHYAALGVSDDHGRITDFITSGITPAQRSAIGPLPQGHGLLGALITEASPMRVSNISRDPRSQGFPPHHPPMTSLLGVPIVSNDRVVGDLYLTDKIGAPEFSQDDQELLSILARHAAVAIDNSHLYEEARAARDQLRAWNRDLEQLVGERTAEIERINREVTARILSGQEEERKRIARELHDETAQSLSTLMINLDLLKPLLPEGNTLLSSRLSRFEQVLRRTLDEVRAMAHALRPTMLDDFGLAAALEAFAHEWMETFGVPVQIDVEPPPDGPPPSDVEVALFRIAQEALTNTGKYARASTARVSLSFPHGSVVLVIEDDGVGFEVEQVEGPTRRGGLGLYGMHERAALVRGSLSIESGPGQGTRIRLAAPLS